MIADRVRETTTSTSTTAITLSGAVTQFQSFANAFGSNPNTRVTYAIVGQGTTEWEVGAGTFNGTTGLTRELVYSSSNSNALTNFSAGTKDVYCTAPSIIIANGTFGCIIANARGLAML